MIFRLKVVADVQLNDPRTVQRPTRDKGLDWCRVDGGAPHIIYYCHQTVNALSAR